MEHKRILISKIYSRDPEICTGICNAKIESVMNIYEIFKHLSVSETVLGYKYHNNYEGDIKSSGCFFNQITINMFLKNFNKKVNIKLFGNGCLQLSGIKHLDHSYAALEILSKILFDLNGMESVNLIQDSLGITYNETQFTMFKYKESSRFEVTDIYNNQNVKIGSRKGEDFTIRGLTVYLVENKYFYELTRKTPVRKVFNINGDQIGYVTFTFKNKAKYIILKKYTFNRTNNVTREILDKKGKLVGTEDLTVISQEHLDFVPVISDTIKTVEIPYNSFQDLDTKNSLKEILAIDDLEERKSSFIESIDMRISNLNLKFQIMPHVTLKFDKISFFNFINGSTVRDSDIYYNPESKGQPVVMKLYYNNTTHEILDRDPLDPETPVKKISIIIFNNCKMLVSGCTNMTHALTAQSFMINLVKGYFESQKETTSITLEEPTDNQQNIDMKSLLDLIK
jgi:hypothetical protein